LDDGTNEKLREALREAFRIYDMDQDGTITMQELKAAMKALQLDEVHSEAELEAMMQSADTDANNEIDFAEFGALRSYVFAAAAHHARHSDPVSTFSPIICSSHLIVMLPVLTQRG
jgi:hypothetical protein